MCASRALSGPDNSEVMDSMLNVYLEQRALGASHAEAIVQARLVARIVRQRLETKA